jgi:hypothetical protein
MTEVPENWTPIWRGLSMSLLRDGYCSLKAVEKWAKEHKWLLRTVGDGRRELRLRGRSLFSLIRKGRSATPAPRP